MPRILIVDDEPLIALLLEDWLTELGFEAVGPVNSVAGGLSLIDGAQVDGAILDLTLADGSSYPLADALKARGIPLVIATGHSTEGLDARLEGVPTLAKPFDFEAVKRAVCAIVPAGLGGENA